MKSPTISVIMPAYNHEKYIGEAIESVLNQSFADLEFIIINDGSTDKTDEIIRSFNDSRIKYYTQDNADAFNTINRGLSLATGKYISIINSDDVYHVERLAYLVNVIETQKATFLITNLYLIDEVSRIIDDPSQAAYAWFSRLLSTYEQTGSLGVTFLQGNLAVTTSNFFFLANVINEIGLFKPYRYGHDYDYALRALARYRGKFMFMAEKKYLNYRVHGKNTVAESPIGVLQQVFAILLNNIPELMNDKEDSARIKMAAKSLGEIHVHEIQAKERVVEEKERIIQAKDQQLSGKDQQLAERNQQLAELNQHLAYHKKQVEELLNSYSWRITAPLRSPGYLLRKMTKRLPSKSKQAITGESYRVRQLYPSNKNRPRIVHALANFMIGGSSRLVVDLIEHLGHLYEQEVITSFIPDPPSYVGLSIYEYPFLNNPDKIIEYLKRFQPSLLHVHYWGECDKNWYEQVILAAKKYGCKIIENINTPVEPYFCDSIDQYVYVSEYVHKTFGRQDEKSSVIYPGSNFDIFKRVNNQDVPDNCIGMVYRLEPDKLYEQSINVFIKVAKRRPGTKIVIVGGGTFLEPYKNAVQNAGAQDSFVFTGYVPYEKLPELYEQMSIFVAPVWKESFGQVSSFAMNMGIPVVGYNIGALPEIIANDELLAPPGDSDRLADIIIDLLNNHARLKSIGASNRKRVQSLFSVQAMINSYAKLYKVLIEVKK